MLGIGNPFDDLWDFVTAPFAGLASWAGDTIFEGITNWIAKGCVQLLGFVWAVMDHTTTPRLDADWFAASPTSPYQLATRIGGAVLLTALLAALAHGVATGDVSGLVRRVIADLPLTVFTMVALTTLTQAALGLTDAMSDQVWQATRPAAVGVFDGVGHITATMPGGTFLAPLVLVVLMAALLFLWFVLMLRDALIYLVVVLAIAFAVPGMVWPALRGMARHTVELLAALVVAKTVIALALAVGVQALGGIGATGHPGDGVIDNGMAEFGTLVVGIITFGLAAFMPYLVYRLLPVVAGATIAAGVASGPLRAASTGMQFQYYAQSTLQRLSTNQPPTDLGPGEPTASTQGPAQAGAAAAGPSHAVGARVVGAGSPSALGAPSGGGAAGVAGPAAAAAVAAVTTAKAAGSRAVEALAADPNPQEQP